MNTQQPATAAQAYDQAAARIQGLIKRLENGLKTHSIDAGQRPKDWGFVGDLHSIETKLQELTQAYRS